MALIDDAEENEVNSLMRAAGSREAGSERRFA
jgi:hypothetical protein